MSVAQALQPYRFTPVFKQTLWGGRSLQTTLDKRLPPDGAVGESWEISDVGSGPTPVDGGEDDGASLKDLIGRYGGDFLGPSQTSDRFPLLYKFIDAAQRLSVQVHPDDTQARAHGWGEFGKTEAWYVVDAHQGAGIVTGFKPGVTIDAVRDGAEHSALDSLLHTVCVRRGDVVFVPAGTVHAIGGGVLLYEIQESSDTTFRLYDWGRVDKNGRPRALHVDEALAVLDTAYHESHVIAPIAVPCASGCLRSARVACRYFALEEYAFGAAVTVPCAPVRSFRVCTVIDGEGRLDYETGSMACRRGQSILIPAALKDIALSSSEGFRVVLSWVPDIGSEIIAPLRRMGISDERIAGLGGHVPKNDVIALLDE
jgi:mannose-6-phosphate isomerase